MGSGEQEQDGRDSLSLSELCDQSDDIPSELYRDIQEFDAKREEYLTDVAQAYYSPGYLYPEEWEALKTGIQSTPVETDFIRKILNLAAYRKLLSENGLESETDQEWPAKGE